MQYLIPAIITGLFTVLATALTVYKSDLSFIFLRRKRNIKGVWRGKGDENVLTDPSQHLSYDVTFQLRQFGSRVTGDGSASASNGEHYHAKLKGQMEDDHFVTLVARSPFSQDFFFGVLLLELDAKGKRLNGYALGNGLTAHGIALAKVSLSKEPN